MRRPSRPAGKLLAFVFCFLSAAVLAGCGGNPASPTTPLKQPGPATPTPTPTPTPMPTPTPTPAQKTPVQWQASAMGVNSANATASFGSFAVDLNGNVTVQVSGVTPNTDFPIQFCPFPSTVYTCFDAGATLITDASGSGTLTFHFPKTGTWAGYFRANAGGNINGFQFSTYDSNLGGETENLQKASATNPQGTCGPGGCSGAAQDALASGSVTVTNMAAHLVLTGAAPDTTYDVGACGSGGSDCYHETNVTTDASGNATADFSITPDPTGTWTIDRLGAQGFVSGFVVP